ncbi:MAG: LysR family transcriptional regulator [Paracoccaceae bacterium]
MPLTPPNPQQLPLNALRAFEAAARHGSFQRAAEELSVSAGAIAQQIRKLEDWAAVRLFDRHPHGVTLTPIGEASLPDLVRGFEALGGAARTLRQNALKVPVRIATLPAIAQLWLGPRMSALQHSLPDVELSVHALDTCPRLSLGAFDVALYPQNALAEPIGHVSVLAQNSLVPVAAPALARTLQAPKDLKSATLIHDTAWKCDWRTWLGRHNVSGPDPVRGPSFSLYSLAVERCVAGDGVLIGHTALLADHLADERLVMLFRELALPRPPICAATPTREATLPAMRNVIAAMRSIAPISKG